jgi:hypothetical protein
MSTSLKLEGFAALERELAQLARPSPRKASARRALRAAAKPLAEIARDLAPRDPSGGDLAASIAVSTKLSKRQARRHRRMFANDRAAVEMFVGPGPDPAAWNQEFGNIHHDAQPFLRPAWDQDQRALLDRLKVELWADIEKALTRARRRAARHSTARG